ncbi:hypothetical protein CEXT_162751 [Caerostris extrusa]|uniref:Uncharacterized protein n=1 Tax=Caerostris extrusa TaxID=172846 RepID=A0AAV4QMN0_CAEEX|nr:hypothetical protein CEXT_162751 [Caerostris extrusa]
MTRQMKTGSSPWTSGLNRVGRIEKRNRKQWTVTTETGTRIVGGRKNKERQIHAIVSAEESHTHLWKRNQIRHAGNLQ